MTDAPVIMDPSARFVDEQYEDLCDFIFRLTGDRSRAAVMGREACRLMKDELESQIEEPLIRSRLFQLAYELNEEAMRPVARGFFEAWYRHQHRDPRTVATAYRWELRLLELGHHAAQLLLLRYRYDFPLMTCAEIMNRDEEDIKAELKILESMLAADKGLELSGLKDLPRYGFLDMPEQQTTALSHIMQALKPRQSWWQLAAVLLAFVMIACFFWWVRAFTGFSSIWRALRGWWFS